MSATVKAVYKILKELEKAMDYDEFDMDSISHERLKISQGRWEQVMILLAESGYIKGVSYSQGINDARAHLNYPIRPEITMRGIEYLEENTLMKKAANVAKGIADMIP